ncbi:hypothetical protein MXM51_01645 [Pantoea stewartii]|uniref:hypothetical protein n=1 Tax=Pantoea stewartii TaxID=66269 RepID=UPI002DBFFA84|nr:hypothetical protein [Pantoea stewartii]MEB6533253.1 hypothetical protein [Pantoea stewartii]
MRQLTTSEASNDEMQGCGHCGGNGHVEIDHGELGIENMTCPKCSSEDSKEDDMSFVFTGIHPLHLDKNLQPGEYIVEIKTPGGAAILNGVADKHHKAVADLWALIFETIHASKDLQRLESDFYKWAQDNPDLHDAIGREWIAAEEEHHLKQLLEGI